MPNVKRNNELRNAKRKAARRKEALVTAGQQPPYIVAALICERVLKEEDNVFTAVRVVDTMKFDPVKVPQLEGDHLLVPHMQMFLCFRTEYPTKNLSLEIFHVTPSGRKDKVGNGELNFSLFPPGHAITTSFPVQVRWEGVGRYWYDIVVGKKLLTKVAFNLQADPGSAGEGIAHLLRIGQPTQP